MLMSVAMLASTIRVWQQIHELGGMRSLHTVVAGMVWVYLPNFWEITWREMRGNFLSSLPGQPGQAISTSQGRRQRLQGRRRGFAWGLGCRWLVCGLPGACGLGAGLGWIQRRMAADKLALSGMAFAQSVQNPCLISSPYPAATPPRSRVPGMGRLWAGAGAGAYRIGSGSVAVISCERISHSRTTPWESKNRRSSRCELPLPGMAWEYLCRHQPPKEKPASVGGSVGPGGGSGQAGIRQWCAARQAA